MTPPRLSQTEFIAIMAMNLAMVAFSIDAMLPALPEIGADLVPGQLNQAQLVITSFVFGMAIGTLFAGPLSDRFQRKPVILLGAALFILGAALAARADSLGALLIARMLQGFGAAAPRIVTIAIVRDLYQGRQMARIMSFTMMVFAMVPAISPLMGAAIIDSFGWRMIFVACILFCLFSVAWLTLRQRETLSREDRRPFQIATLWAATKSCFEHRVFNVSILAQAFGLGMLFACLSSTQQIFDVTFGRAESFPLWFALIALLSASASILNARLVIRLGMQRMIMIGFAMQMVISGGVMCLQFWGALSFKIYLFWTTSVFFMAGLTLGNLNALAMEPLGHIAGLAASLLGSISSVLAVIFAIPIGLAFQGTPLPLATGLLVMSALGFLLIRTAASLRAPAYQP